MKKRSSEKTWIPFWVDKWIFGSMRIELNLEERAIWIDLLALAAKDDGYIRANEGTPYPLDQLAGMLIIPLDILEKAIDKFIKLKKIRKFKSGILYIVTWEKYQFTDRYKRQFGPPVPKKRNSVPKKGKLYNRIEHNRIKNNKRKIYKKKDSKKIIDIDEVVKSFEILWKDWPGEGRAKHDYCLMKFKALCKQGLLSEFRETTIGYFEYLKHKKINENFEQQVMHLSTWLNNWKGEKERYHGFRYKPRL